LDAGRRLYAELARRVTGLALPNYVLDIPGGFGKAPVADARVIPGGDDGWRVFDRSGAAHDYPGDD
jgi:lysine 2,3-aminomutase